MHLTSVIAVANMHVTVGYNLLFVRVCYYCRIAVIYYIPVYLSCKDSSKKLRFKKICF